MKSIFLKKQGESPKNKILDFLIVHAELDYSLKEIADYSGAGYSTVKLLAPKLAKDKWLVITRKISKVQLYKLNTAHPEVKKFIEFYWAVINQEIGGKRKENSKIHVAGTSSGALPMSAKGL